MKFPILMYHRVEDPAYMHKVGLKLSGEHCTLERFRSQMRRLKKDFSVWSLATIVEWIRAGKLLPDNVAALTFGDGTRDQVEVVLPILEDFGFTATFFIMSKPLEGIIPPTFGMQLITGGSYPIEKVAGEFWPQVLASVAPTFAEKWQAGVEVPAERYVGEPNEETRQMKYLFNYQMPAQVKEKVCAALLEVMFGPEADVQIGSEKEIAGKMFMQPDDLKRLVNAGMDIGCHSRSHYNLATVESLHDIAAEVIGSREMIAKAIEGDVKIFSYPAGGFESFDSRTDRMIMENYNAAVITGTQKDLCDSERNLFAMNRLHEKYFEV